MGDAATNAAAAIGYQGVGTIEFLWEEKGFYFMEMNTRIQVRSSVQNMTVTGLPACHRAPTQDIPRSLIVPCLCRSSTQ